jgi:ParB family chromosome partitioning protein
MRHDAHYVDALTAASGEPVGRMVSIERLDPNPDQPRQAMGDLSELMASIEEKGVIEPLIVRQREGRYQIIAGERRYQAAVQIGLQEMPVIIRDADDRELIELALIENLQRKDLTPFEEAVALAALAEKFGHTHEELARRLGKSRTSVTESLSLQAMPDDIKQLCQLANITSKSLLLEVVRQRTPRAMTSLIERLTRHGAATRKQARAAREKASGRSKPYVYNYAEPRKKFELRLSFRKSKVGRKELINTLERILEELRQQEE